MAAGEKQRLEMVSVGGSRRSTSALRSPTVFAAEVLELLPKRLDMMPTFVVPDEKASLVLFKTGRAKRKANRRDGSRLGERVVLEAGGFAYGMFE